MFATYEPVIAWILLHNSKVVDVSKIWQKLHSTNVEKDVYVVQYWQDMLWNIFHGASRKPIVVDKNMHSKVDKVRHLKCRQIFPFRSHNSADLC